MSAPTTRVYIVLLELRDMTTVTQSFLDLEVEAYDVQEAMQSAMVQGMNMVGHDDHIWMSVAGVVPAAAAHRLEALKAAIQLLRMPVLPVVPRPYTGHA